MKKVLIVAYDTLYQGLHGMYNAEVFEVDDNITENALWDDFIRPMAIDVIESYGLEEEHLKGLEEPEEEDFDNEGLYQDALTCYEESCQDCLQEACDGFHAWLKPTDIPIEELNDRLYRCGYKEFINEYCTKELF